jgi:U2-associated protein SR140
MDRMMEEMMAKNAERDAKKTSGSSSGGKSRQIDSFLQELKSSQSGSQSVQSMFPGSILGGPPKVVGSFDNGDPATTNLYVGNLAPTITEEVCHVTPPANFHLQTAIVLILSHELNRGP